MLKGDIYDKLNVFLTEMQGSKNHSDADTTLRLLVEFFAEERCDRMEKAVVQCILNEYEKRSYTKPSPGQ